MPEEAPGKSFENPRGAPRWPQARFTPFLQVAVTPSMRAKKFQKKVFKLDTCLKKAVSKIEVGRRLQSLHVKGVFCMRRQDPSQITGRHDPEGD